MYGSWQLGVVYFSGTAVSIDGRTPLPVDVGNLTLMVAAGILLSIAYIFFLPRFVVQAGRVTAFAALLSGLTLFLPFPPELLAYFYYFHCFCCVFMVGFETAIITNLFSVETILTHLFIAYAIGNTIVAIMQNDFLPLPFETFRLFIIIALLLILFFFFKLPTKVWPVYVKKEDGLTCPKSLFVRLFMLGGLGSLMTIFGISMAENVAHGVFVTFISSAIYGLFVFLLWKVFRIIPIRIASLLIGVAAIGFVIGIVSLFVSNQALSLVACALLGGAIVICNMPWFFGFIMMERYPTKWISPLIIGIAFSTLLIHSVLLDAFRGNLQTLYTIYLIVAVGMAILYLVSEPYLTYAYRGRQLLDMEQPQPIEDIISAQNAEIVLEVPSTARPDSTTEANPALAPDTMAQMPIKQAERLAVCAFDRLSRQELRLAELIMRGYTNTEISTKMKLTIGTVKVYRKNLYSKLQIHSKRELFELAEKNGRI